MLDDAGLVIRVAAAVTWAMLMVRSIRLHRKHGHYLRRILRDVAMTGVLAGLVLRGMTILGILPDAATGPLITVTVFVAFIVGFSLLTTQPDP